MPFFAAKGACGIARLLSFEPNADRNRRKGESGSVFTRRGGPTPTPYSRAAGRRAARSAPVHPRGSGRSRRAGPQRQTRPKARTHPQARFRVVARGPEITPHHLWKRWITRVCVNRRRCALRALKRRRPDATLRGRAKPANSPNVRADQTYGGARSNSAVRMIFVSRGAALGPCGWPNAAGRRGERPVPRLYSLLAGDRQGSSGSMIRSAQTAQFFPAVRGRSVGAHH